MGGLRRAECAANIEFVQYYLGLWGYPSPELFARRTEDGRGSRGLLIALAWTLSHHRVLDVAVARQHANTRPREDPTVRLPPYPQVASRRLTPSLQPPRVASARAGPPSNHVSGVGKPAVSSCWGKQLQAGGARPGGGRVVGEHRCTLLLEVPLLTSSFFFFDEVPGPVASAFAARSEYQRRWDAAAQDTLRTASADAAARLAERTAAEYTAKVGAPHASTHLAHVLTQSGTTREEPMLKATAPRRWLRAVTRRAVGAARRARRCSCMRSRPPRCTGAFRC